IETSVDVRATRATFVMNRLARISAPMVGGRMRKIPSCLGAVAISLVFAVAAQAGDPQQAGDSDTLFVGALPHPPATASRPHGNLLITQKAGDLKLFDGASTSTLVHIPVCSSVEMGLLGIALDPNFATNGFIYLYRTHQGTPSACSTTGR